MFENLENTNIAVASEEDLAAAAGTPPTDDKNKGKGKDGKNDDGGDDKNQGDDKGKTKGKKINGKANDKSKDTPVSSGKKTLTDLSSKDLEIALGSDDDDDDNDDVNDDDDDNQDTGKGKKKDKKDDKKAASKKKDEAADDDDQDDDDDDNQDDDDQNDDNDDQNDDDDNQDDDDDDEPTGDIEVKDFLKARVDLLIKSGKWFDFEGRDEVEWDEETFEQVEIKQQEAKEAAIREDLLGSFGPYGSAIADYAAKGGDPEKLIDIFKEQQRVENLSIETEDDQKTAVLKYATEFQGMKPKQAQTYVNALIADKELADAAKEAKESMEQSLKDQEQELKDEQDEQVRQREAKTKADLQKFSNDVSIVLNQRTDLNPDEKKELIKVLTKFDKKLKNGVPVNEFYFKFAEFKKNLPDYIDLVRFVLDKKKFVKTQVNKGKTEANDKAFKLVRTGNKVKKTKSSGQPGGDSGSGKKSTFKLIY